MQCEGTVMAGKEWCQDYEGADHIVYVVRKQKKMMLVFSPGTRSWNGAGHI